MAGEDITRSTLWIKAFAPHQDGYDEQRERFASALLSFRKRAGNLLTFIPGDMRHYTVHDISHLDALWEMADLIAGEQFTINPAEAFVFGGAVLLHDAGMSLAAYPRGFADLVGTNEWKDALTIARKKCARDDACADEVEADAKAFALADILRLRHAEKAEELATQYWTNPDDGAQDYLIEDSNLRSHFGAMIGAIAHSHHWSTRRLFTDLQPNLGAFDSTPSSWTVDSVKVALLLRCADAAHIDHRRAPRLLFGLTRPTGLSFLHWSFQAKLAKPQIRGSKLLYTSKKPFTINEVEAWQLCWDAVKMIDRELSDACDILADKKMALFCVSGVVGAKAADSLARHVEVDGWRPVPTEIQVSDVPSLARTLGGQDLYSISYAPLRELIQNAADAIDARIAIDDDFDQSDARITVRLTKEDAYTILSVEDNGVGMSERTLTGALIDFGMSFWRSEPARVEFPGLHANFKPRGRYGIGFFSTFMWADCVKVCSRKFSEGFADARVLEFSDGLGRRPILRGASSREASAKFSTRVELRIPKAKWEEIVTPNSPPPFVYYRQRSPMHIRPDKEEGIALLCGMLKIPVYLEDGSSAKLVNIPNWEIAGPEQFISFIEKMHDRKFDEKERKFARAEAIIEYGGQAVGRAFLSPIIDDRPYFYRPLMVYEFGILVGEDYNTRGVVGFVEGRAGNAARDKVEVQNVTADTDWFARQVDYMRRLADNVGEAIACQDAVLMHGKIIRELPLFLVDRNEMSLNELVISCSKRGRLRITLVQEDNSDDLKFIAKEVEHAFPFIGKWINPDDLYFLTSVHGRVPGIDGLTDFVKNGESPLAQVLREVNNAFGPDVSMRTHIADMDSYSRKKILIVEFTNPL